MWRSRSAGVIVWRSRSADVKEWRSRSADVRVWRSNITAAFLRRTLRRRSREKHDDFLRFVPVPFFSGVFAILCLMTATQTNRKILAQKTSAPNLSNSEITLFCDGRNMYPPVIKRGNGKSSANEGSMGTSPIIYTKWWIFRCNVWLLED